MTSKKGFFDMQTGKYRRGPDEFHPSGSSLEEFYGDCKKIHCELEEKDPREWIEIKLRGLPTVLLRTLLGTDMITAEAMYRLHNTDDPKWCNTFHSATLDSLVCRFGDDKLGLYAVLLSTGRYDRNLALDDILKQ